MKDSSKLFPYFRFLVKVLFLVPYPVGEAPSQRFRFEQYFSLLRENGIEYQVQSFLPASHWRIFHQRGNLHMKIVVLFQGFLRRIKSLFTARQFDFVFIHREATPIGPPLIEFVLARILRKRIIYDFDDAIWLTDRAGENALQRVIKWRSKVKHICRWSYRVSCGNAYLSEYATRLNPRVICNPTTIDTKALHVPADTPKSNDSIVIGWTGSHSTLKYLHLIEGVLARLAAQCSNIRIRVIADQNPELAIPGFEFCRWNKESEIADLMAIDIGIMPLPDDDWSRGKCGFKQLQYMALEIPGVASAVGANLSIIDHGVNGFLASSDAEWYEYLGTLIRDSDLRRKIGKAGREKVHQAFSVTSNAELFLGLFSR